VVAVSFSFASVPKGVGFEELVFMFVFVT
jgi:hypothetical protein